MGTFSDQQQTQHRHSVTNVYGIQTKMKLHFKLFALFAALAAASAVTGSKDPEAALVQVNESQSDSTSVAALNARIAALESVKSTDGRVGCDEGHVPNCSDDECCPASWIEDGLCDNEDQEWGCDLTCYECDGGDCECEPEDKGEVAKL